MKRQFCPEEACLFLKIIIAETYSIAEELSGVLSTIFRIINVIKNLELNSKTLAKSLHYTPVIKNMHLPKAL
jgi:hypothetical protein